LYELIIDHLRSFVNQPCASLSTGSIAVPVLGVLGDAAIAGDVLAVDPLGVGAGLVDVAAVAAHLTSFSFRSSNAKTANNKSSSKKDFREVFHDGWFPFDIVIIRCYGVLVNGLCATLLIGLF